MTSTYYVLIIPLLKEVILQLHWTYTVFNDKLFKYPNPKITIIDRHFIPNILHKTIDLASHFSKNNYNKIVDKNDP